MVSLTFSLVLNPKPRYTIMYKFKRQEYMVKTNINVDLIIIIDSSMISFIVILSLWYSSRVGTKINGIVTFS